MKCSITMHNSYSCTNCDAQCDRHHVKEGHLLLHQLQHNRKCCGQKQAMV
jgi:hypothetical protein